MRYVIGAAMGLAMAGCTPEEPAATAPQQVAVAQGDIGGLLNAARAGQGLPVLVRNAQLDAAAWAHAQDMMRTGNFSHTGSNGSKPSGRVKGQGYGYCYVAENIAQGQRDATQAMQSWMDSPGHRRNNLSSDAREFGAARGKGDYWVLVFGRSGC